MSSISVTFGPCCSYFPSNSCEAQAYSDRVFAALDSLGTGRVRGWVRQSRAGLDRIHPRRQEQPRAKPGGGVGFTWRTGEFSSRHTFKPKSVCFVLCFYTFGHFNKLQPLCSSFLLYFKIFYRVLREIPAGEELSVWYSNALAQWYDIPTTATPTHDEKGN